MYLEHHCDFLISGTSAPAGKLNSTIINGYKQILGKFGEIQREFVDVYSPDSDNDCRGGGGGHQHLHPPCARFLHIFREIIATKCQCITCSSGYWTSTLWPPAFRAANRCSRALIKLEPDDLLIGTTPGVQFGSELKAAGFQSPLHVTPGGQPA